MTTRRPLPRRLATALLVAVLALVLLTGGGWLWLRTSLPPAEGRLALPGLEAPVEVLRDQRGVPTIRARNERDAYFALGVAHAQDRLWQMEMMRRAGQGRLAELFGAPALGIDRYLRSFGLYRLAEASLPRLAPEVRAALRAYADGVNAWLARNDAPLAPEFLLLRHAPEPWRPADSLVWGRLMALQLSGNWMEELRRTRAIARVGPERAADLWAGSGPKAPVTLAAGLDEAAAALLAETPDLVRPRLASNAWVLDGAHTTTGAPLLANDPHLGFEAPVLWYLARIETPGRTLVGATVPGVPFHIIGHNRRIAWGFTTTHSDSMDLFLERRVGDDAYETPDGSVPFETREEVIEVKDAAPVTLTLRRSRHGPVVSDLVEHPGPEGTVLALAAAFLEEDDRTAQALYNLNRAENWDEFTAALRDFHSPQQNIMFAATDGTIGLYAPGRVPVRRKGDGTVPRPGWTGEYDWTGWVPFEALPHTRNPGSGRIVNANNRLVAEDYPHLLAAHWPEGHRARRIEEALAAAPRHDLAAMQALQMDTLSPMTREMLALLREVPAPSKRARQALERLEEWDHRMDRQRPEPLIALAWLHRLQQRLIADDLGALAEEPAFRMLNPRFLRLALTRRTQWCDDRATEAREDCTAQAAAALEDAQAALARALGDDMEDWRWGAVHRAVFAHELLTHVPGLDRLANLSIATDGGDFTVNRGTYAPEPGMRFRHRHGPGLRVVYDLGDLDNSRFVIATGQSGNPLSPHYDDMLADWRDGRYVMLAPGNRRLLLEPSE